MGRPVEGAVGLVLAAAQAVDLDIGLQQLDIVRIARTFGSPGRLDIVLSAAVAGTETVLAAVDAARDLDVALAFVGDPVQTLDEALGQHAGVAGRGNVLVAEGHGAVLALPDDLAGLGGQHKAVLGGRSQGQGLARGQGGIGGGAEEGHGGDSQGKG